MKVWQIRLILWCPSLIELPRVWYVHASSISVPAVLFLISLPRELTETQTFYFCVTGVESEIREGIVIGT